MRVNDVLQIRYKITGILSAGDKGSVYQARDMHFPTVTRYLAIKEMRADSQDPTVRATMIRNFVQRVELWMPLQHPTIPLIYDYFSEKGRAYLVMKYINGRDLEAIVNSVTDFLPSHIVCKWAIQLCDALHYLHTHEPPIIFHDLKPSNIMIDQAGDARLINFGMARIFQTKPTIGPEGYAPPEWFKGRKPTPKGDIYALGATLHHTLTRRDPRLEPPFSFALHPIRSINPKVSPDLEAVVMRALMDNPQRRFRSALTMKQALERLQDEMADGGKELDSRPADKIRRLYSQELRSGEHLLATLTNIRLSDWPWFASDFLPTDEFELYRSLLEGQGQFPEYDTRRTKQPDLTVNVPGSDRKARIIVLHIRGNKAYFKVNVEDWPE